MLDLAQDLKELIAVTATPDEVDTVLRQGLDCLRRVVPYDLATVFLLDEGGLRVHMARGPLANEDVRQRRVTLDEFPSLRDVLETRRARAVLEAEHAHGDGDLFDGVLDLPHGHSCMVVPLCAGDRCHGLLALDRNRCEPYDEATVAVAEAYGAILALAYHNARQRLALAQLNAQGLEQTRRLEQRWLGEPLNVLRDSVAPCMRRVVTQATQVAATDTPVLILGETGTGKERLSRAIHAWSARAAAPFVALNAAAIPEGLVESELFGHVKGAFTGALRDRPGAFQAANGGTLLLDEIGDLPLDLQTKLLRVLQERQVQPVGGERVVPVDVRVIAATHVDLEGAIEAGRFRRDLYYRLAVFPLALPPLRERLEDLPQLCEALLTEQAQRTGRSGLRVGASALTAMRAYAWPGNLRELANALERAAILCKGSEIGPEHLTLAGGPAPGGPADDPALTLAEVQRRHIRRVLERTGGKIAGEGGAARLLGLKPTTLRSRMQKLGVARTRDA
ncbi:MAG: sigma 54-interacting transcriptional regulator [Planctomycetes bacterium]|nr:sigma 54-interacting transcriptional regulator [Planctomycetota bacterium]